MSEGSAGCSNCGGTSLHVDRHGVWCANEHCRTVVARRSPPAHEPDTVAEEMLEALRRENKRLREELRFARETATKRETASKRDEADLRRENERLRGLIAKAWEDGFVEGADGFAPDPDRPTEYARALSTEDTP